MSIAKLKFNLKAFERLRKTQPDAFKKIIPVEGDLISDNLGLSPLMLNQFHNEVNIVFHCAATLKLEANLRDAIDMNTTGTWRLIKICREMKNLECLVHLSTAFCYADFDVLDEKVKKIFIVKHIVYLENINTADVN